MRLDVRCAGAATGLDDVGVEGALDEELDLLRSTDPTRRVLEDADELTAHDLPLRLRIADPAERFEEAVSRVDDLEPYAGGCHEVAFDLLCLSRAEQAVVHEHAGELGPDSTLH